MSRFGGRHSSSDLAYGDEPNRWDRDRFERFRSRGPPGAPEEQRETIRIQERDAPRRTDIRIEERDTRRGPKSVYDERDFDFMQEERYGPPARIPRHRVSDRDLFAEIDRRELDDQRYKRKSAIEREVEIDRIERPRPGLIRRQSSLDTFDRRPLRREREREREEYRLPPNVPIPLPRRRSPSRRRHHDDFEDIHYREYSPYRDVEITRERSHVRKRDGAKSDLRSVSARSDSTESFEEISRASSPSPERKVGKKGKTRMPKRLVKREAIIQLGYPFEEEEDFIIVRRALEKEQIDEVIRISENYKAPKTKTYRFEETLEVPAPPPPPAPPAADDHYEALRTEWINPPSVRAPSPARSTRTRRSSPARTVHLPSPPPPQPIYIHQPAPPPVRETIYVQSPPAPAPPPPPPQPTHHPMTIVLPERHRHSDRDIKAEIRALEAEQRALRYERQVDDRNMIVRRPDEAYEVVEYREHRPEREQVIEYVDRPRSPKRDVIRVEKDRKGRMALVRTSH
ncbi:hypothetical protein AAFC00_001991 [Neodothiora populina]|uniref:DUF8035 domain-containing protein n=1 Tax=Neodothiora populina TaxID=2781224 RepID=A0ABR3PFV7_9PEZI